MCIDIIEKETKLKESAIKYMQCKYKVERLGSMSIKNNIEERAMQSIEYDRAVIALRHAETIYRGML
jgi:hypothetical protein